MSRPGSDDSPGSSPLAAPAAASGDARDQALSLARESVQADVAAFGEEQREQLRLKFKSLDEIEGGFGTALVESFPDFLPRPEMLKKTRQVLAQLAVLFEPEQAELASILSLGMGRSSGDAEGLLGKCEEGMIKVLARIEEQKPRPAALHARDDARRPRQAARWLRQQRLQLSLRQAPGALARSGGTDGLLHQMIPRTVPMRDFTKDRTQRP